MSDLSERARKACGCFKDETCLYCELATRLDALEAAARVTVDRVRFEADRLVRDDRDTMVLRQFREKRNEAAKVTVGWLREISNTLESVLLAEDGGGVERVGATPDGTPSETGTADSPGASDNAQLSAPAATSITPRGTSCCHECDGRGWIWVSAPGDNVDRDVCGRCNGRGGDDA